MTTSADIETADRLSRRRARMLFALAIIFLAQQVSYLSGPDTGMRTVDHVKIAAWLVMSIVLLLALTTGGFWFRSRQVRDLMDDDITQPRRVRFGFMAVLTAGTSLSSASTIRWRPSAIHSDVGRHRRRLVPLAGPRRRALKDG